VTARHHPGGSQPCLPPGARRRPNVLYVVWDDAGIAAWDAFGGLIETPNMKRLAARGLRYSQWHTPALSAATRSCLLTGRNCGAGGMPWGGPDGRDGREQGLAIPPEAATLAEILGGNGYRTYCVGQWQVRPPAAASLAGSYRTTWPLGRGFDRYYGFLGSQTSQWYPELVYDNQHVDPPYPPADGYHLTRDLADMAVEFIAGGAQIAPGRPWFCYLSFGANGAPHTGPREWTDKYRGRFEMGYDRYREIALGSMKRLGVVPESTGLAPVDGLGAGRVAACAGVVRPWRSLSDDQKRASNGLAESYAGLCSYTDRQVGRLLDYLEGSAQLADTIVVVCSANATGADRRAAGPAGENAFLASWPGDARTISRNGDLAAAGSYGQHPPGWAWAFRAPYNLLRQQSHGGSVASPLIISWPQEMREVAAGVRDQYHHAIDIVPTIIDCAAIDLPQVVNGHAQAPLHGVSMRYTFAAADVPSRRRVQRYAMPGARAIYHDGWKAVTRHGAALAGGNGAAGTWELYHAAADRAEIFDVAARYPEKAAELASQWETADELPDRAAAAGQLSRTRALVAK
jgi:arylsulfatase A-like enzyme